MLAAGVRGETAAAPASDFPFEHREGLLWVEVRAAGHERPLRFLLDTGAEVTVVNLDAARRLGLTLGPKVSVCGVRASMTGYWPQKVELSAGGVPLPANALVLDLSKLSRSCEHPVDGLIGADFFRDKVVQLDFVAGRIRTSATPAASAENESLPLEIRRSGMCVRARVNGSKPQRLRLDTGCASALQWVTRSIRPAECTSQIAVGLAEVAVPQARTTLVLGRETFPDVPTGIHRQRIFPGEAGLLGNGLLARFEAVTLDTRSGRLWLGPRRHPGGQADGQRHCGEAESL